MTVEEIYRDITNQIVNLKILPGEKIKEEDDDGVKHIFVRRRFGQ